MAKLARDWIATNCREFFSKHEWPLNSSNLGPLHCCVWEAMLERYILTQAVEHRRAQESHAAGTRSTKPNRAS